MVKFSYIKVFSLFTGDYYLESIIGRLMLSELTGILDVVFVLTFDFCLVLWNFICTARHVSIIAVNTCA